MSNPFIPSYINPPKGASPQGASPPRTPEPKPQAPFEVDLSDIVDVGPQMKRGKRNPFETAAGVVDMASWRPYVATAAGEIVDFGRELAGKPEAFPDPFKRLATARAPGFGEVFQAAGAPSSGWTTGAGVVTDFMAGGPLQWGKYGVKALGKGVGAGVNAWKSLVDKGVDKLGALTKSGNPNALLKLGGGIAKAPAGAVNVASNVTFGAGAGDGLLSGTGKWLQDKALVRPNYVVDELRGRANSVSKVFRKYRKDLFPKGGYFRGQYLSEVINKNLPKLKKKLGDERRSIYKTFDEALSGGVGDGVKVKPKIFTKANDKAIDIIKREFEKMPKEDIPEAASELKKALKFLEKGTKTSRTAKSKYIENIDDFIDKKKYFFDKMNPASEKSINQRRIWKQVYGIYADGIKNFENIAAQRLAKKNPKLAKEYIDKVRTLTKDLDTLYAPEKQLSKIAAESAHGSNFGIKPVFNPMGGTTVTGYASGIKLPTIDQQYAFGRELGEHGNNYVMALKNIGLSAQRPNEFPGDAALENKKMDDFLKNTPVEDMEFEF